MLAGIQQLPPLEGMEELDPGVLALIGLGLVVIGLVLGFAGRIVWKHVMSLIGAILGGLFGFVIGSAIGGPLVGLIVSLLGAMVGSGIFVFLAKVGLVLTAGFLGFTFAAGVTGNAMIGLVVGALALGLTAAFIDQAIGIVTAIVGGLLVGIGLAWMERFDMGLIVIAMLAIMVFGSVIQMKGIKDEQDRRRRAAAARAAAVAVPVAPVPPPVPGRTCSRCNGQMRYVPEYNRYYCDRCQDYD
jgi:hypothetical protein